MGIFDKIRSTFSNTELDSGIATEAATAVKGERRRQKRLNARDDTRALIIDDSPTIVFVLKKILRSAGFITLEALDAVTGVEIARAEKPDLIFSISYCPGLTALLRCVRYEGIR